MKPAKVELVRPSVLYRDSFLAGLQELPESEKRAWLYRGDSAPLALLAEDFETFVNELLGRETQPPSGFVKDTVFWAKIGDEIVGRISVRHELNEFLIKVGGHIGYIVRPRWRGQGVATAMLREVLLREPAISIRDLLLTCDETNAASEKTILKNGGVLENILEIKEGQPKKKRFWVRL